MNFLGAEEVVLKSKKDEIGAYLLDLRSKHKSLVQGRKDMEKKTINKYIEFKKMRIRVTEKQT